jgi:hypothetical protein
MAPSDIPSVSVPFNRTPPGVTIPNLILVIRCDVCRIRWDRCDSSKTGAETYHRHLLPEITAPILRPQFERLEMEFEQILDVLAECFRRNDCRREFPSLRGALAAVDQAVEKIAVSQILLNQSRKHPCGRWISSTVITQPGRHSKSAAVGSNLRDPAVLGDYAL